MAFTVSFHSPNGRHAVRAVQADCETVHGLYDAAVNCWDNDTIDDVGYVNWMMGEAGIGIREVNIMYIVSETPIGGYMDGLMESL